jgi:hypothetical protein
MGVISWMNNNKYLKTLKVVTNWQKRDENIYLYNARVYLQIKTLKIISISIL